MSAAGYSGPSDSRVSYWGVCDDPKGYRYCGYAEALAKGSLLAREGIRTSAAQHRTGQCMKERQVKES